MKNDELFLRRYISENYGLKDKILEEGVNKLIKYNDIYKECMYWIENKNFLDDNKCVKIEGYTAEVLSNTLYLKGIAIFNFLVDLREKPNKALEIIKNGLKIK